MEEADRVRSAAHAGDEQIREAALLLQDLFAGLHADHPVEIADHHREGMRPERRTEDVVRVIHGGHPIAHRFVHGFLEGGLSRRHGADFRSHQAHAGDVESLSLHVHRAHVNHALHAEARAHGGGGDAVLSGPGFGNDPLFPQTLRQQDLADGVVDLVRAGVQQVFPLQINFRAAQFFRPALGEVEGGRSPDVVFEQVIEFALKLRVFPRGIVCGGQLLQGSHQGFRHEHAAEFAEVSGCIGKRGRKGCHGGGKETQARDDDSRKNRLPEFPGPNAAGQLSRRATRSR